MKFKTKSVAQPVGDQSEQYEGDMGNAGDQVCSREQMVAEAAYYLSEQRGFSHGNDVEDWLAAEAYISTQ